MTEVEYLVASVALKTLQERLNSLAVEGWRLHTLTRDSGGDLLAVLERELASHASVADPYFTAANIGTLQVMDIPILKPARKRGRPSKADANAL